MTSPTKGGGGSTKRWSYSVSLFSKMGDKGKGGVKNLKKWVTLFMDSPRTYGLRPIMQGSNFRCYRHNIIFPCIRQLKQLLNWIIICNSKKIGMMVQCSSESTYANCTTIIAITSSWLWLPNNGGLSVLNFLEFCELFSLTYI